MTDWVVNGAGLALMGFIVWWFWLARPRSRAARTGVIEVLVSDGVYDPARIEVAAGRPVTLRFLRKDPTPCAEKVIFPGLGLAEDLPLDEYKDIVLEPEVPGEYAFTCQMQMYRGTVVVNASSAAPS